MKKFMGKEKNYGVRSKENFEKLESVIREVQEVLYKLYTHFAEKEDSLN